MKYLGIDYGTKRVGIAISDEAGRFAFPKEIIVTQNALSEIVALCEKEQIGTIVIGKSMASNGMQNEITPQIEEFKKKLNVATKPPKPEIVFQEEGFSTVEAHRYQTDAGNRDDSAAAIILQRFLDSNRNT